MTTVTTTSPGARKAAVLLLQLGQERAAKVLAGMSDTEVEAVTGEIARLEAVGAEESSQVLEEFRELLTARMHVTQGGLDFAKQLLTESLGEERAADIVGRLDAATLSAPFHFLRRAEPGHLRSFIAEEHPQVIALVIAHMPAAGASTLLSSLSPELQAEVAHRLAVMGQTTPEMVRLVESTLERRMTSLIQPTAVRRLGGIDPLVDIINRADRSTERQIVEGVAALDAALAEELKSRMFMFEDIVTIEDRSMQLVLREVDAAQLALALKGVPDEVREKVTNNISSRAAEDLVEEIEVLGTVRLSQVEEAQQVVISAIRRLEEQGQIMLRRGGDDDFVS